MYSYWAFLDNFDANLLNIYINSLSHTNGKIHSCDKDELVIRNNGFYLIWFVYRYILKIKTLDEALKQSHKEIFQTYKLWDSLVKRELFIGVENYKITFFKEKDIEIILEILYNRYTVIEQFQCFIRSTPDYKRKNKGERVLKDIETLLGTKK